MPRASLRPDIWPSERLLPRWRIGDQPSRILPLLSGWRQRPAALAALIRLRGCELFPLSMDLHVSNPCPFIPPRRFNGNLNFMLVCKSVHKSALAPLNY